MRSPILLTRSVQGSVRPFDATYSEKPPTKGHGQHGVLVIRLIPLPPALQNVVAMGGGSVLEQISNTMASGGADDRFSAFLDGVSAALLR
jgi:hypothetical protein